MLKGAITALITPMKEDLSVDYDKLATLIESQIKGGIDGLLILGTTGEATTLTNKEAIEVLRFAIKKVNHRVPVIANSGSNNTQEAIEKSKLYSSMGVDYLLVITPYYNKTSPSGLLAHFKAVANASQVPILLYHIPGRTGMTIPFAILKELSQEKNIIGMKEASGDIHYLMAACTLASDSFHVFSGDDDLTYVTLSLGGSGVISTFSNLYPQYSHELTKLYFTGETKKAWEMQQAAFPVMKHLFTETNPIPVKKAFQLLNQDMGNLRLPLVEMSKEKAVDLAAALKTFQEEVL